MLHTFLLTALGYVREIGLPLAFRRNITLSYGQRDSGAADVLSPRPAGKTNAGRAAMVDLGHRSTHASSTTEVAP